MTSPHNDFDVAKSINDLLEPLNDERRQRILRWVSESLGFSHAPAIAAPAETSLNSSDTSSQELPSPRDPGGQTDIKSFVESKSPKSDQQFSAVVAYFYRFEAPKEQQLMTINTEILQDATRLAGRSRLTNPKATLNNAKNAGYLNSSTVGEFEISTVGENLVAMTLPSGDAKPQSKKKTSKKKTSKKKTSKNPQ